MIIMDIDISSIEKTFVKNFIQKKCQEQVLAELKNSKTRNLFLKKLNQEYESILKMGFLKLLDPATTNIDFVKTEIETNERDLYYVLSNDAHIDGKVMEVNYALSKIYGKGITSIIMNLSADHIYFEIANQKFVGKINE